MAITIDKRPLTAIKPGGEAPPLPIINKGEMIMSENKIPYKIYLGEEEIPKKWYNLRE